MKFMDKQKSDTKKEKLNNLNNFFLVFIYFKKKLGL